MAMRVSFRLKSFFVFVAIVAALTFFVSRRRTPMASGVIQTAICYERDWSARVKSLPATTQDGAAIYNFNLGEPEELLKIFPFGP